MGVSVNKTVIILTVISRPAQSEIIQNYLTYQRSAYQTRYRPELNWAQGITGHTAPDKPTLTFSISG